MAVHCSRSIFCPIARCVVCCRTNILHSRQVNLAPRRSSSSTIRPIHQNHNHLSPDPCSSASTTKSIRSCFVMYSPLRFFSTSFILCDRTQARVAEKSRVPIMSQYSGPYIGVPSTVMQCMSPARTLRVGFTNCRTWSEKPSSRQSGEAVLGDLRVLIGR